MWVRMSWCGRGDQRAICGVVSCSTLESRGQFQVVRYAMTSAFPHRAVCGPARCLLYSLIVPCIVCKPCFVCAVQGSSKVIFKKMHWASGPELVFNYQMAVQYYLQFKEPLFFSPISLYFSFITNRFFFPSHNLSWLCFSLLLLLPVPPHPASPLDPTPFPFSLENRLLRDDNKT